MHLLTRKLDQFLFWSLTHCKYVSLRIPNLGVSRFVMLLLLPNFCIDYYSVHTSFRGCGYLVHLVVIAVASVSLSPSSTSSPPRGGDLASLLGYYYYY